MRSGHMALNRFLIDALGERLGAFFAFAVTVHQIR